MVILARICRFGDQFTWFHTSHTNNEWNVVYHIDYSVPYRLRNTGGCRYKSVQRHRKSE